jgi:hypothetical protein
MVRTAHDETARRRISIMLTFPCVHCKIEAVRTNHRGCPLRLPVSVNPHASAVSGRSR